MMLLMLMIISILIFYLYYKLKKHIRDKRSIVSWYKHMIDQYRSIYQNVAVQFNEKMNLAEKYHDQDCIKRLKRLYDSTVRAAENIERKLDGLKTNITAKKISGVSSNDLFNNLKIVESYIAELVKIAKSIRSIQPLDRRGNRGYAYEKYNSYKETKNEKTWKISVYFSSCNTKEELAKKFRELAKIYHPDNAKTGNEESFKELKAEYDEYILD